MSVQDRNTTRGSSGVPLGQEDMGGVALKELVCRTCGQRSYTVDGVCVCVSIPQPLTASGGGLG